MPSNATDTQDRQVIRMPLASPIQQRTGQSNTANTDVQMINCYAEKDEATGLDWCVQRPGLTQAFTYNSGGATNAQGMTYWKGCLFAMGSNTLYRVSGSAGIGSTLGLWTAKSDAPWAGRSEFSSCVFQGQMWVYSGLGSAGFVNFGDLWSSKDGIHWTPVQMTTAPSARTYAQLVAFNDQMFLIGGSGGGNYLNDVWATSDGVNWTQVVSQAPWAARNRHTCVAVNMGIVLMGGNANGTLKNDVWFSGDGITWTQSTATAPWSARMQHSSVFWQGKVWVIGGFDNVNALADVYWSIDAVNWTAAGSLPAGRYAAQSCVYRNQIFVISGNNTAGTPQSTVYNLQSVVGAWVTTTNAYPKPVSSGAALALMAPASVSAVTPTVVWVLGGFSAVDGYTSHVYQSTIDINMPSSWAVGTGGTTTEQFKFTTDDLGQFLVFKNNHDAWIVDGDVLSQITDTNFPTTTVPGIVTLDDTVYVMDGNGTIYGADISNPYVWNPLSFVTAEFEADTAMALAKHQNYVVALKQTSAQFFYDAGIAPPDAAIAPLQNANVTVGCAQQYSVAQGYNTLFWVAQTRQRGPFVVMLDGLTPSEISTPTINRLLSKESVNGTQSVYGWFITTQGRSLYLITSKVSGWTYVYDVERKQWHQWKASGLGYFNANRYTTDNTFDYVQHDTLGKVYQIDELFLTDDGSNMTIQVTTPIVDGMTNLLKFCSRVELIGDPGSYTVTVLWSDDNFATFGGGGAMSMSSDRHQFAPVGAFRRRAFRFFTADTPPAKIRWLAAEFHIEQGAY